MPATAREFGDELLRRLLEHAAHAMPGMLGAGLVLAAPAPLGRTRSVAGEPERTDGEPTFRVAASVGVAGELDAAQLEAGKGPLVDVLESGAVVAGEVTFPDRDDVRGAVITSGEWGEDQPVVLTTYFDAPPDADRTGNVDHWEALLSQALAVVEYCAGEEVRAEQMLQMTQYRRVVEQAKGAIMAVTATDAQAAFTILSRASQHFNVRLRTLAVALVELVGDGEIEHPEDPAVIVRPADRDRQVAQQVWQALTAGTRFGVADQAGS